jgi:hypothetical protein
MGLRIAALVMLVGCSGGSTSARSPAASSSAPADSGCPRGCYLGVDDADAGTRRICMKHVIIEWGPGAVCP